MSFPEMPTEPWMVGEDTWTVLEVRVSCSSCGFEGVSHAEYILKSSDPYTNVARSKSFAEELATEDLQRSHEAHDALCEGSLVFTSSSL